MNVRQLDRFELREIAGQGAFGVVHKAYDTQLQRIVAIKLPRQGTFSTAEDEQRFLREARQVARLNHPNIVPVFEIGQCEGAYYIVSEFIDGLTLSELINHQPLGFRESADMLAKISDAVQYAHDHKVVHRDLKPGNILLNRELEPFVTDFGLARTDDGEFTITLQGQVIGTPSYMSPEQVQGDQSAVGPLSDIYSLGVVFYRMLTGELPFRGGKRLLMYQIQHEEPRPPRNINEFIPVDFQTIALKAMFKDPERRYASAGELAEDLRRAVRGEPIKGRPVSRIEKTRRLFRKYPVASSLSGLLVLLLFLSSVGGYLWAIREAGLRQRVEALVGDLETGRDLERRQLARQWIDNGNRQVVAGHYLHSLPWHAEALELESQDSDRDDLNRLRLGNLLAHSPRLMAVQAGHSPVRCAKLSPDNRYAVCGFADGRLLAWDIRAGGPGMDANLGSEVSLVEMDSRNRFVAAADTAGGVSVYEYETGMRIGRSTRHSGHITSLAFTSTGDAILSTSIDGTARLWRFQSSSPTAETVFRHSMPVRHQRLSQDQKSLFTISYSLADQNSRLTRWSVDQPQRPAATFDEPATLIGLACDESGSRLGAHTRAGLVHIWDISQAGLIRSTTVSDYQNISYLGFLNPRSGLGTDRDNPALIATRDGGISLIDSRTGAQYRTQETGLPIQSMALNGEQRLAVLADSEGQLHVWDLLTHASTCPPMQHAGKIADLQISRNQRYVLSLGSEGVLKIWDISQSHVPRIRLPGESLRFSTLSHSGQRLAIAQTVAGDEVVILSPLDGLIVSRIQHPPGVTRFDFSPDETELVTGCTDGLARIWNVATGQLIKTGFPVDDQLWNVRFNSDGSRIIGDNMKTLFVYDPTSDARPLRRYPAAIRVTVWDRDSGEPIAQFAHDNVINEIVVGSDPDRFATICHDKSVVVWDIPSQSAVTDRLHDGEGYVQACKFSGSGQRLLTACGETNEVVCWDLADGLQAVARLTFNATPAVTEFLDDPFTVITGCHDGTIHFSDLRQSTTGSRIIRTLGSHIASQQIDRSGRLLMTTTTRPVLVGGDRRHQWGATQIWNIPSRELLGPLYHHTGETVRGHLDPKGRFVAVCARDGTVEIHPIIKETRSMETVRLLAELLSGNRVDATSELTPLSGAQMQSRWEQLKGQQPETDPSTYSVQPVLQ